MNFSFQVSLIIYLLFVSLFSFPLTSYAANSEQTDPFVVSNIQVDVTADNAKQARDNAFIEAQKKSLDKLFLQLEENGYNTSLIRQADAKSVANAVRDFEILNEKISSVRYIGDFVFRYDRSLLNHFFSTPKPDYFQTGEYSSLIEENGQRPSQKVLILPFFRDKTGRTVLWENNPWKTVWDGTQTSALISPIGDLSDIQSIKSDEPLTYNPTSLGSMIDRYEADKAYILIATQERYQSAVAETLRVSLYDTSRGRPDFFHEFTLSGADYNDVFSLLKAGQQKTATLLMRGESQDVILAKDHDLGIPKNSLLQTSQSFQARFEYASLQHWIRMKAVLSNIPGIQKIDILSLSSRQAEIEVSHNHSIDDIATALTRKGYNLQETGKLGRYILYSGNQSAYNQNGGIIFR